MSAADYARALDVWPLIVAAWREWRDTRPALELWPEEPPPFFVRDELGFAPDGWSLADTLEWSDELAARCEELRHDRLKPGPAFGVDLVRLCWRCDLPIDGGAQCARCFAERRADNAYLGGVLDGLHPQDEIDWDKPDGGRDELRLTASGAPSRRRSRGKGKAISPSDAAAAAMALDGAKVDIGRPGHGLAPKTIKDRSKRATQVVARLGVTREGLRVARERRGLRLDEWQRRVAEFAKKHAPEKLTEGLNVPHRKPARRAGRGDAR